jgi:sec-independent protein translocase protein TatB
MFDIGFSEIVVIAVVALIVIGPEKLPKTARTLGLLFGRLQRYVSDVKADISREIELDELRKLQQQVQSAAKDIETSVTQATQGLETSLRAVESDLNAAGAGEVGTSAAPALAAEPAAAATPPATAADAAGTAAPPAAPVAEPAAQPAAQPAAAKASAPPAPEPEPVRQASLPGFERG